MLSQTTAPVKKTAPGVGVGSAKNRVWDFFGDGVKRSWEIDPQVVERHLEKTTTERKTALGVPHWPSRDPIGEQGGVNLYGFVGNDGVNGIDVLGLDFWKWFHDNFIGDENSGAYVIPDGEGGFDYISPDQYETDYPGYVPEKGTKPKPGSYRKANYVFSAYYEISLKCDSPGTNDATSGSTYDVREILKAISDIPDCCCIEKFVISAHHSATTISAWPNIDRKILTKDDHQAVSNEVFTAAFDEKKFCDGAKIDLLLCNSAKLAKEINAKLESGGKSIDVGGNDGQCISADTFDPWITFGQSGKRIRY